MKRKITYKELVSILRLHSLYLEGKPGGEQADLRDADLTGINMVAAAYEATGKDYVALTGAHMEGADFSALSMKWAHLDKAYLSGALFSGTFLKGGTFRGSDATGADFTKANLMNADFRDALLREADFSQAKLRDMEPSGASFEGAVFSTKTTGLEMLIVNGHDNEGLLHAVLDSDPRLLRTLQKAEQEHALTYPEKVKERMDSCRKDIISELEKGGLIYIDIPSGAVACIREKGKAAMDQSLLNTLIPQKDQHIVTITDSSRPRNCRVFEDGKLRSSRRSMEEAVADAMEILGKRNEDCCWQKDTIHGLKYT